jgi:aarF domain-containing kinase
MMFHATHFSMITIHAFGMVLMLSLLTPGLNVELQNPPTAAATSPNTMPSFILNPPGAADLRRLFERLGATYIKLGQFIASAPTLFPAEYVKEFQSCLDKTPAVPFNEIKAIIRQELGRPLEEVYDFIDPQPLASASVAQVQICRGILRKQKCVIVQ